MEWRYVKDIDCMMTTEEIAQIEGTSPAFVRKLHKHNPPRTGTWQGLEVHKIRLLSIQRAHCRVRSGKRGGHDRLRQVEKAQLIRKTSLVIVQESAPCAIRHWEIIFYSYCRFFGHRF